MPTKDIQRQETKLSNISTFSGDFQKNYCSTIRQKLPYTFISIIHKRNFKLKSIKLSGGFNSITQRRRTRAGDASLSKYWHSVLSSNKEWIFLKVPGPVQDVQFSFNISADCLPFLGLLSFDWHKYRTEDRFDNSCRFSFPNYIYYLIIEIQNSWC